MKKMILSLGLILSFVGCNPITNDLEAPQGPLSSADSKALSPVTLDSAKAYIVTTLGTYPNSVSEGFLTGNIVVANLGYTKNLQVHYKTSTSTVWQDASAGFLKTLSANSEVWSFTVKGISVAERFGFDIEFAIKYTVNGVTYWDSNNSANYKLGAGPRTFNPPVYMGAKNVLLDNATISQNTGYPSQLVLAIDVKNLGYSKNLKVRYTRDNWKTFTEAAASYQYPFGTNLEYWYLQTNIPTGTQELKLALCYQVNGSEYWDNNYGLNYTVKQGLTTR